MDWKKDLLIKGQQLNLLEKGDKDGHSISCSSGISMPSSRGSNNVHSISVHKEVITNAKEREVKAMITAEGADKDLTVIENETKDEGAKAIVKALKVVVKFLSTMRSNQLLTEADKVRIAEDKKKREATKK